MNIVIEAFDKNTELLVSETILSKKDVVKVVKIIGLSEEEVDFLNSGAGGFDLTEDSMLKIGSELNIEFCTSLYDYQLGSI